MTSMPERHPQQDRLLNPSNSALVLIDCQPAQISSAVSAGDRVHNEQDGTRCSETSVEDRLAFTVELEHMSHDVDGERQERTLRASQGYRFEDEQWRVVFRHGDPLAEGIVPTETGGYP